MLQNITGFGFHFPENLVKSLGKYTIIFNNTYMAAYVVATDDNFKQIVLESELPVLVDFWAPWCGPCQMMGPVIEKVAVAMEGKAVIVKYDVQDNQEFAAEYGVQGIPAFKVFKGGKVVDEAVGGMPETNLTALIEKHL